MTAPVYIEQLLNDYLQKSSFYIVGSTPKVKNGFTLIDNGYVSWSDGEGQLTLDPFSITTKSGNDYVSGKVTPIYPYFSRGSVMDAVEKLEELDTKRMPLFILDTLDRSDTPTELGMNEYDLRAFLVMAEYEDSTDQWTTVFDPYLDPLADNMIKMLKKSMFTDEKSVYHERWGDNSKYGQGEDNILGSITNCIEITGTFIYNKNNNC